MSAAVLRVQDSEGRGPYRPGFSHRWSDSAGQILMPWWEELGESLEDSLKRMVGPYHWGCGFRTYEQFSNWFSLKEQLALDRLGFSLVAITPTLIVAETPSQVVFGTSRPLTNVDRRYRLTSDAAQRLAA
jgi:hypothetical protein